ARHEHQADFVRCDGCDVELAAAAQVDFHERGRRLNAEMLTEAEAPRLAADAIEARPPAHIRLCAVGADDPAGADAALAEAGGITVECGEWCAPQHLDAESGGAADEMIVQQCSTDPDSVAGGELR